MKACLTCVWKHILLISTSHNIKDDHSGAITEIKILDILLCFRRSQEGRAKKLTAMTKKKSEDLLKVIREPLKMKDCSCGEWSHYVRHEWII